MNNRRKICASCHAKVNNAKKRCPNCSAHFTPPNNNRAFLAEIRKAGSGGTVSEKLRHYIQTGVDVNTLSRQYNPRTGLMQAASVGNHHIVQFLIGLPAIDINQHTEMGSTALSIAASGGHRHCVSLLLATPGIAVNHQNIHGTTALMASIHPGRTAVVQCLLQYPRINVNIQDHHGQTALMIAAGLYRPITIVTMVRWHLGQVALGRNPRIDVNLQNDSGATALMRAVTYNKPENVRALLALPELNIVCMDNDGNTALTIPLVQKAAQELLRSWHRRITSKLQRWRYITRRKRRNREKGLAGFVSRKKNQPPGIERHQKGFLHHSFLKLRF